MGVCDVALQIIELAIIFYMPRLGFSTAKEAIKDSQLDYENIWLRRNQEACDHQCSDDQNTSYPHCNNKVSNHYSYISNITNSS
jgi:hypothetical protein